MSYMQSTGRVPRNVFFVLFTLSGFAGLIYESIWSHYIKLFLGHAAYAQTLVLAIFMGGMAIGAWFCARRTKRWKNLLIGYAIAEFLIGVLALVFHNIFVNAIGFAYETVFPALGSPTAVDAFKWMLAGALILPQSILLGTTFPLMTAGIMRLYPQTPGSTLSMLYFTNSLGAAIGVLTSGFYLIEKFGMPGTLLTAGLLNITLAMMVWATEKFRMMSANPAEVSAAEASVAPTLPTQEPQSPRMLALLLGASLLTGAASFCYEIGWIRMLSLVLGSSTHAFEIMLSAFILGLAFGGLWIKRKIDTYQNIIGVLALVLIAKGAFALATLPVYGYTFDLMKLTVEALTKTDFSYGLFNLSSHFISLTVMFPAAFCAGMSLPLITFALLSGGYGESSIGKVYAWNTAGAIVGVLFAVHVGMPILGLKNLVVAAAAIDIGVAIGLLILVRQNTHAAAVPIVTLACVIVLSSAVMFVEFDLQKTSSGVYRHGRLRAAGAEIVFHKDGKTATVDVVKNGNQQVILTNGKADAAIVLGDETSAEDESTMVLLAVLPLAHKPDAKKIANIGFGSGMTTHTLLGSSTVEIVDTIEIEPAMVEGARSFGDSVKRAYSDPRSKIHFDDAKSFFAGRNEKYDVIVSEPSNPWVSGVSGLFSNEFYSRIKSYLKDDGVLVQWIQLYEIDSELVSSMLGALGNNFSDYVAYEVGSSDIVIVAVPKGTVPPLTRAPFESPLIATQLHRIGIKDFRDLAIRRIGSKKHLQLAVDSFGIPANSDYFPIVDLRASRQRFLGRDAMEFIQLAASPVPTMDLLENTPFTDVNSASDSAALYSHRPQRAMVARNLHDLLITGTLGAGKLLAPELALRASYMRDGLINCVDMGKRPVSFEFMFDVGVLVSSHLSPEDSSQVWKAIENSKCFGGVPVNIRNWIGLFKAVGNRDSAEIAKRSEGLLATNGPEHLMQRDYLLAAGMSAHIVNQDKTAAMLLWKKYGKSILDTGKVSVQMRMLVAMANENTANRTGRRQQQ